MRERHCGDAERSEEAFSLVCVGFFFFGGRLGEYNYGAGCRCSSC